MQDKYVDVGGIRLRYRDSEGAGKPVLWVHGIGASLEIFDALATPAPFRFIALDLPGHGLSGFYEGAPSLERFAQTGWDLLDALGVGDAVLAGNSMGGAVCLRMAAAQPRRVNALLLLAAATLGREAPLPFRLMTLPGLGALLAQPGELSVKQQIAAIVLDPASIDDSLRSVIMRNVMRPGGQAAFLKMLRAMTDLGGQRRQVFERSFEILAGLACPVLFAHGREDSVIPFRHSEQAQARAKGSRFELIGNCGHTPQWEAPQEVLRLLTELVAVA